jgi:serine protease Do
MMGWKTAGILAGIVAAAGAGVMLAPAAYGQSRTGGELAKAARVLEVFGGGSRIGVSIEDVDEDDVKRSKLPGAAGVLVAEVHQDSAAEKAGLKKGDIIVEFDGERVRSTRQFTRLVQETPSGRQVQASVIRDGQRMTLTIQPRESDAFRPFRDLDRIEEYGRPWVVPPTPPATPAPPARPAPAPRARLFDFDELLGGSSSRLGITVGDLSTQLAEYFGTKDGVLVTAVLDGSSAAKAGVKAGDVIVSFNGADVTSPSELRRRLDRVEDGEEFTIGIVRDKKPLTLKGKLEDRTRRRTRTVL